MSHPRPEFKPGLESPTLLSLSPLDCAALVGMVGASRHEKGVGTWPVITTICQSKMPGKGLAGMAGWGRAEKMFSRMPAGRSCIQTFFDWSKCFMSIYDADTRDTAATKLDNAWPRGTKPLGRSMGNEHTNKYNHFRCRIGLLGLPQQTAAYQVTSSSQSASAHSAQGPQVWNQNGVGQRSL